jgi:hypothetical protein
VGSFFGGICSYFCNDLTIIFFLLPLFFCCRLARFALSCFVLRQTVCLQGTHAIWFFHLLEPVHVPLHRVAFMCIICLLDKAVLREYQRIVNCERQCLYGFDFVSSNSDFYTNKERRESCGCLVANITARQHIFEVCWCGFSSCHMLLF